MNNKFLVNQFNKMRWEKVCLALNIKPDYEEFARLEAAYSESHRAYHTSQHLSECFDKLDWAISKNLLKYNSLVEIALWYHDAIYNPKEKDNERKSAAWALKFLSESGVEIEKCELIYSLIMATCHRENPQKLLHQIVVDIDLSILGAESLRFQEYEQQIRQEYKSVPWLIYQEKRVEILNYFLSLPSIYNTKLFYQQFESQARQNLEQSIVKLRLKF